MHIYSKFKDYYDCGMNAGYDDNAKFIRNTFTINEFKHAKLQHFQAFFNCRYSLIRDIRFGQYLILFCGKEYRVWIEDDVVLIEPEDFIKYIKSNHKRLYKEFLTYLPHKGRSGKNINMIIPEYINC